MDVLKSQVTDPGVYDKLDAPPQTAWRIDRMKNMTYTQFWQLVKERRVDKVLTRLQARKLSLSSIGLRAASQSQANCHIPNSQPEGKCIIWNKGLCIPYQMQKPVLPHRCAIETQHCMISWGW